MRFANTLNRTRRTAGFSTVWFLFLAWLLFVALVIAGADQGGHHLVYEVAAAVPFGDKLGHVFLIGTLAGLLNLATKGRRVRIGPFRWLLGGVIVAVVMTIEEVVQLWIPTRTCDPGDLIANYLGVILAGLVWTWSRRRGPPEPGVRTGTTA